MSGSEHKGIRKKGRTMGESSDSSLRIYPNPSSNITHWLSNLHFILQRCEFGGTQNKHIQEVLFIYNKIFYFPINKKI